MPRFSKVLEKVDLKITSRTNDFICVLLKSQHDADCVGELIHRVVLGNMNYISTLSEYLTDTQLDEVRQFFLENKDNLQQFHVEYGPELVLVSKSLRVFKYK